MMLCESASVKAQFSSYHIHISKQQNHNRLIFILWYWNIITNVFSALLVQYLDFLYFPFQRYFIIHFTCHHQPNKKLPKNPSDSMKMTVLQSALNMLTASILLLQSIHIYVNKDSRKGLSQDFPPYFLSSKQACWCHQYHSYLPKNLFQPFRYVLLNPTLAFLRIQPHNQSDKAKLSACMYILDVMVINVSTIV